MQRSYHLAPTARPPRSLPRPFRYAQAGEIRNRRTAVRGAVRPAAGGRARGRRGRAGLGRLLRRGSHRVPGAGACRRRPVGDDGRDRGRHEQGADRADDHPALAQAGAQARQGNGHPGPAELRPPKGEWERFGEFADPRERARLLDQGLEELTKYWGGTFEPVPLQRPRIPVWVGAEWPHRRPVQRALRWDGIFPTQLPGPAELAELTAEIRASRPGGEPFDVVVDLPPGDDPGPWEQAGATWVVTDFGPHPTAAEVRSAIEAGPPA